MSFSAKWAEVLEAKGLISPVEVPAPRLDCSEKEFQAAVVKLAKAKGWLVYRTRNSRGSEMGFPDLMAVRERVVYAELKTKIGDTTPAQKVWIAAINSAQGECYVWRPSDWPTIKELLK